MACTISGAFNVEIIGTQDIIVTIEGSYGQEIGLNPKREIVWLNGLQHIELNGQQNIYIEGELTSPKLHATFENPVNLQGCLYLQPLT